MERAFIQIKDARFFRVLTRKTMAVSVTDEKVINIFLISAFTFSLLAAGKYVDGYRDCSRGFSNK